jgi:NAD(P)H-hydrate epimerase
MRVVTAEEMRALDKHTIEQIGVPGAVLMETAGRAVVELVGELIETPRARIAVWAGAGNNGGDGFVVARHLANRGARVQVVLCAEASSIHGEALVHFEACRRSGVEIRLALDEAAVDAAADATAGAEVIVDALFGTGLVRALEGRFRRAVDRINAHAGLKIAVDVPSGLDSDRGVPLGACVRADHTVTFALPKRGLVGAPGFTFAGELHVADIGIPERLAPDRCRLNDESVLAPLASADPLAHKGTYGHLAILAGSTGKTGAALLCGRGALRGGAGLTTVIAPLSARDALDGQIPELMTAWYPGEEPVDPAAAFAAIEPVLDGKDAIAAGPGIPTGRTMGALLRRVCTAAGKRPVVLDADALNLVASTPRLLDGAQPGVLVLTPHPGEAARLLGRSTADVQADRYATATELARKLSAFVALKGARTVIATPDGRLAVNPTGNPGLGAGGTGDVLTGVTGALLARGIDAFSALCAAVWLHGAAGDRVAAERGARGFLAHEVADAIPRVLTDCQNAAE